MMDATPLLRLYARHRRRRLDRMDPAAEQERQLLNLVRHAAGTRFGRDHGFAGVRSVADFQARVPLRSYEDFWTRYWQDNLADLAGVTWPDPIPYLAVTSGTSSGTTKYIPVSRQMVASNRQAGFDLLVHHAVDRPHSRIFGGKNFMLGGTVDLTRMEGGVLAGDLTGIAMAEVPRVVRRLTFPPPDLAGEADWERKIATVGPASLEADIRTVAGTASWLLVFFERLAEMAGREPRLAALYPNLELLVHGGVNFEPYRERFDAWLDGSRAERREVYPASEGFVAMTDAGPDEGLRVNLDLGLFFEFVPAEDLGTDAPRRHWIGTVETGRDYAIAVSSCAGVWAYLIGDLVRFVSLDPPRLVVAGRTSEDLSAFGEHLTGEEVREGLQAAAGAIGEALGEFSVGVLYPAAEDERGGHLFVVELAGRDSLSEEARRRFVATLDSALAETNDDYRDHRRGDLSIRPPTVRFVPDGAFAAWMRARGKLGGQNKVPRVVHKAEIFEHLRDFTAKRHMGETQASGL